MSMQNLAQLHYERFLDGGMKPQNAIRRVNTWLMIERVRGDDDYKVVAGRLAMKHEQLSRYVNLKATPRRATVGRVAGLAGIGAEEAWWEPLWGSMWEVVGG